jgi:hypothetical protein
MILCALGLHAWRDSLFDRDEWETFVRRDCAHCPSSHIHPVD